jgi:hypothetical protein
MDGVRVQDCVFDLSDIGQHSGACSCCGEGIEELAGEHAGAAFFLSGIGENVRFEREPLCPSCGTTVGLAASLRWAAQEDEG